MGLCLDIVVFPDEPPTHSSILTALEDCYPRPWFVELRGQAKDLEIQTAISSLTRPYLLSIVAAHGAQLRLDAGMSPIEVPTFTRTRWRDLSPQAHLEATNLVAREWYPNDVWTEPFRPLLLADLLVEHHSDPLIADIESTARASCLTALHRFDALPDDQARRLVALLLSAAVAHSDEVRGLLARSALLEIDSPLGRLPPDLSDLITPPAFRTLLEVLSAIDPELGVRLALEHRQNEDVRVQEAANKLLSLAGRG